MSTVDTLDFVAPEFAGETTATKEEAIKLASQQLSSDAWSPLYVQAVAYLAAHILKLRARTQDTASANGIVGPLTSIKTGDLSISGAGAAGQGWESTEYGQHLLAMQDRIVGSPFI